MTVLFRDPVFLEHDTGRHPETAERLRVANAYLDQTGLAARCTPGVIAPIDEAAILRLHSAEQLYAVRTTASAGGGMLDADTVVSERSFDVARMAAGACAAAVDAVLTGSDKSALCLVRPPGHHATPTHCMGFCLFNSIALAADLARAKHGLQRILIVDWDVHHGNGTQDIFYADPTVMYFSIHRYGGGFYPGTGAADEGGTGAGLGFTLNVPIRCGVTRQDYLHRFRQALDQAAERIMPELVLVSAGFDAHRLDPIGGLGLEAQDFASLTRAVLDVAQIHTGGRVVSCLEGGYHWQATAESIEQHLSVLLEC